MSHTIISPPTLTIIFHCTLFGLLAYKLYELSKGYLLPWIHRTLDFEKRQQMQIIEKEKLLLTTKHRLDDQIASQQKLFMLLKKNTQQWTQYVNAKKAKQEEENKCIAKQLKHKKVQQQKRLLAVHEIKYVIPEAITLAKLELSRQYTAEKGTVHLKNIIESLNTNKS